jgi:flagellin-like hook-associated protein FlgL
MHKNRLSSHNDNLGKAIVTVASGERVKNSSDRWGSLAISESLRIEDLDISTADSDKEALVQLQEAVGHLSGARTRVDATQNHFTRAIQNLCPNIEHLTATASAIRDADVAKEVTG